MTAEFKKICRVCGDIAIGCNYNGQLSCTSCRMFFYRNFHRRDELKCYEKNQCKLTVTKRKECSKCRLEKCLQVGMTIRVNRTNSRQRSFRSSGSSTESAESTPTNCRLSAYERQCIGQINESFRIFRKVAGPEVLTIILQASTTSLHHMITTLKNDFHFRYLPLFKQSQIVKGLCYKLALTRFGYSYNPISGWFTPSVNGVHCRLKNSILACHVVSTGSRNVQLWSSFIRNDETIRNLLSCILIVRPLAEEEWQRQTGSEYLKYLLDVYFYLLQRYLMEKFDGSEQAEERFDQLMVILRGEAEADVLLGKECYYRWIESWEEMLQMEVLKELSGVGFVLPWR